RLGVIDGTNALGAPIRIPHVLFSSFNTNPEHRYTALETRRREESRREEEEIRFNQMNHGPKLLDAVEAKYPVAGLEAKLEGVVDLLVTVGADRRAHDIRVKGSRGQRYESMASWASRNP